MKVALGTQIEMLKEDSALLFCWEWPKGAHEGWRLREMADFLRAMEAMHIRV